MAVYKNIPERIVIAELTVRCVAKTAVRLNLAVSIVELASNCSLRKRNSSVVTGDVK